MVQAQARSFPGYGVVYPDGVSGIKVVGTFTQGPSKTVNPDGSVAYSTPAPTIHELFGGGFAYASGSPVTNREHLEMLPGGMRTRALEWFDGHGKLSEVAKEDIPPLNLDEKQRPEPVYVLSSNLPVEKDEVTKDLDAQVLKDDKQTTPDVDVLSQILLSIKGIAETVKEQGKQIADLKKHPPAPKRMGRSEAKHGKQSEAMKARWADPVYKAKMTSKGMLAKWKDKGVGENVRDKKRGIEDGEDTTKTG